jgi:hydrogenase nickel incorporation protein HypA/HybF
MHELSITENMLSLALGKAGEANAKKITRINLILGELSGVVGECVQQYFEFIGKDTIAEGAALTFEKRPTVLKCRECNKTFHPVEGAWTCPDCHNISLEIISGRECNLESIEVE